MPNFLKVKVYNGNMEILSPVSKAKARLLLKKKKAKVICNHPFTLRLNAVKDLSEKDKIHIKNSQGE
jgi:hypothetical protein